MGCFSGCLMSSGGIQKLFCGMYSAFKYSFHEFVGEKVASPSYCSTILGLPLSVVFIFVYVGAQLSKSYTSVYEYYPHKSLESISLALLSFITSNFYSLTLLHSRMYISSKNTCFIHLYVACLYIYIQGFPGVSVVKNQPDNTGDMGFIPGLGRSPGEGNGKPLQYSCLENPMGRGAWRAAVLGQTGVT